MSTLIDKLLGSIPKDLSFKVELPSKGKFYKSFDVNTGVKVRPMTFKDEQNLVQQVSNPKFNLIDFILENCVTGVNISELLTMDIMAILYKIREISYGDEYKVSVTCPKCSTENIVDFKMSLMPINYVPDDMQDPREVTLPVLGVKAKVRFVRKEDNTLFDGKVSNLWRFIEVIDECFDKAQISQLLNDDRFPIRDAKALINAVTANEYGVVTEANYSCANQDCKNVNIAQLVMGADFFTVS